MSIKETLGTCECKQRTREETETANFEGVVVPEKEINNGNAFFRKRPGENKGRESGKERTTKRSYYKTGYILTQGCGFGIKKLFRRGRNNETDHSKRPARTINGLYK